MACEVTLAVLVASRRLLALIGCVSAPAIRIRHSFVKQERLKPEKNNVRRRLYLSSPWTPWLCSSQATPLRGGGAVIHPVV